MKLIKELLLPTGLFGWIFFVISTLSVVSLIVYGFGGSASKLIEALSSTYNSLLEGAFGYFDPWITKIVDYIKSRLDVNIIVSDHWRPLFILMMGYFYQDSAAAWDVNRKNAAMVHLLIGFSLALLCSLGSGIAGTNYPYWSASFPVIGLFLYTFFGRTWGYFFEPEVLEGSPDRGHYFKLRVCLSLVRTLIFLFLTVAMVKYGQSKGVSAPEVLSLTAIIVIFGMYWMIEGVRDARLTRKSIRIVGESFINTFVKSPYTKVGGMVVRAHFAAVGLIAIGVTADLMLV